MVRLAPTLVGLLCTSVATALYVYGPAGLYHRVLDVWGVDTFRFPFLDIDGPLAARDCARLGIDVFVFNPCDILGRVHNYSPLWLAFPAFPPGHSDRVLVGWATDLVFFASLAFLPPAGSRAELVLRVFAAVSTTVAYAVERANVDVIIFVLVVGVVVCMSRSFAVRVFGYALALLAAALKYYPATLIVLTLRERPIRLLATGLAAAVLAGWFAAVYGHDVLRSLPNIPGGVPFGDMFGAKDVMYDASVLLAAAGASRPVAANVSVAVLGAAAALAASALAWLWRRSDWPAALARLDDARRWSLLAGALVMTGCFAAGQSLDYRGVFFLLVLPGLFALGRDPMLHGWLPRHSGVLTVILMWEQALRYGIEALGPASGPPPFALAIVMLSISILREAAYWAVMIVLASAVLAFAIRAPVLLRAGLHGHAATS